MFSNETIEKFGLSPNETKVYLAALELGKTTAQEIAKKTGLPRSTTYSVLEALMHRTLIFPMEEGKIQHYQPEHPQKIINISEETTKNLKTVLPELAKLFRATKKKPRIKYYQGQFALREMYNDILRQKKLREYLIIASESSWLNMDKDFLEVFKQRRAAAKIKTRLILEESTVARQRQKEAGKTFSEVKIIPPEMLPAAMSAGVYIFPEKVIFIEYQKDLIAVEVQSKGIADLQRSTFELLWRLLP